MKNSDDKHPICGYVIKADADVVDVQLLDLNVKDILLGDGFNLVDANDLFRMNVANNLSKSKIFEKLKSYNIAFSGGKEWSPAEVFENLVAQGHLSSGYKKIIWKDPSTYKIVDVI